MTKQHTKKRNRYEKVTCSNSDSSSKLSSSKCLMHSSASDKCLKYCRISALYSGIAFIALIMSLTEASCFADKLAMAFLPRNSAKRLETAPINYLTVKNILNSKVQKRE